jgi:hypothetical protein
MDSVVNVRKLIILFYFVIPFIFYGIPIIIYLTNMGMSVHFYSTYNLNFEEIIEVFLGHILLGLSIIYLNKNELVKYNNPFKLNINLNILTIFIFTLYIASHLFSSIVSMLTMALFIILIGNIRLYNTTYMILLLISFVELIVFQERYLTIFILILISINFLSKRKWYQLILLMLVAVLFLIFVLQPLRYGEVPFSNFTTISSGLLYLYQHLNPIYYTAYLANSLDYSISSLFFEFIPFGKSLSGEIGIVEQLAYIGLPEYLINNGARLGSNSSMYFSIYGIFLITIMLFINFGFSKIIKSNILTNSILIYLILQGPYFIRRSFASFTIDIIIIICMTLIILMIKQTFKKVKNEK